MSNIEEDINLINLKEISERFSNGTETIEDIINYCRNYEIKFENGLKLRVVEKRYFDKLVERIKELEEKLLDMIEGTERIKTASKLKGIEGKIKELLPELSEYEIKELIKENEKRGIEKCKKMKETYSN